MDTVRSFLFGWSSHLGFDLLDRLDLDLDVHAVADHHAAGLEHLVPGEPEVLPIDRRLRREPGALVAPRVLGPARVLHVEGDFAQRPANREVADHAQPAVAQALRALALEGQLRMALDVQEVRRLQVRVTVGEGWSLADTTVAFAGGFQLFLLPMVLFFACVVVFAGVTRRDVRHRTLHHYLLCPVRREVLLAGRFAAGTAIAFAFVGAGTVVAYALAHLQLLGAERFAVERFFTAGPGLAHLGVYLAVVLLGAVGYGAVFTALGHFVRNPIVPVIAVAGWESLTPWLPPGLKAITVYHYLRGLCPVPIAEGPFALLGEPPAPWLAVLGLLLLAAALLALAGWKLRRSEIDYGDE